jgi:hypothetical protein
MPRLRLACCLAALLSLLGVARADTFEESFDNAKASLAAGRYEDARQRLSALYRTKQEPEVLRLLAQAEARLGYASAAIEHYDRFLAGGDDADPEVVSAVRAEVTRLRSTLPPLSSAYAERLRLRSAPLDGAELYVKRYRVGPSNGMLGTGLTLLLTANAAAMIGGGITIGAGGSDRAPVWGGLMFLPVLGPFLAPISGSGDASWDVTWAVLDGGAQLTGLILTVVGSRYKDKHPFLEQVRFTPIASATTRGVGISGRF